MTDAATAGRSTRDPLTLIVAEWAAGVTVDSIPPHVVHQAKRVVLDYLSATIPGSASEAARIVQGYVSDVDTAASATVIGTALRASPGNAALANGTAAHGLEIDDGYTPGSFHPGGPVLSAVLAAAEAERSSAPGILAATALGFELSCRLAGAGHPATRQRGFHNTPVAGVFGAAIGVASLLKADTDTMANAMGVAGSHAGGLFEFLGQGAEVKRYHAGKAARDGLVSAQLAVRGLTGPKTVLEGPNGYIHAFADDRFDVDHLLAGLGSQWRMLGTYVKPYPCCRHLHGPIDAVLELQQEDPIDVDAIESVVVETYATAVQHDLRDVVDFLDAQMSLPYAVAVTLMHGEVGLEQFSEETRADPGVGRLADLVQVRTAQDCDRDYPSMRPARVTIRSHDRERTLRIDQPLGEPSNPVSDTGLEAKLERLAGPLIGEERCKHIIDEVWAFNAPQRLFEALRT